MNARLLSLRSLMEARGWDAVVLTGSDPHASEYPAPRWKQVEWLTGFSGEAGDVVVTSSHAGLWTDSRYFIAASKVLPAAGFELHKTRLPDSVGIPQWLSENIDVQHLTVAVDSCSHSASGVQEIADALAASGRVPEGGESSALTFSIVGVPDLLGSLWTDRPAVPSSPIITLGDDLSGESRLSKIAWLRDFLRRKGCDAMLLTSLDEIAWVLNVRGADIAYNPLVISYLLVTPDAVKWYVLKGSVQDGETRDSLEELRADGISIMDYEAVFYDIPSEAVYVDPSTLNQEVLQALRDCGATAVQGPSPVPLRKAVKNAVEIAGMREAHVEDGLVMERFLYWLENMASAGERISEWDAACKLGSLRATVQGYRGDSFETISAYGESAALPHYVTPSVDAPLLEPRGLYLCDSGGQYMFGTTDITRTVPLGPCTALEREDYTLVLKGHIDLSMAVFPRGTSGCNLDVLARNPLWQMRRNFGHGTGHGVGSFLCVHEGPHSIRQNTLACPLVPGMVVTDEPGIYREGRHGIRHENVLLVTEDGTNDFGSWLRFEPLTLCHFDTSVLVRELLTREELAWLDAYNERVFTALSPRLPAPIAAWLRTKCAPLG